MAFETSETLVVLDRCSGVWVLGHWIFPRVSEMGWKENVSGTGERVLRLVKLEKKSNQVNAHYIDTRFFKYRDNMEQCLFKRFILTS